MRDIYLDHAATTYVDPRVKEVMDKYFSGEFGNPGSFNYVGLIAKEALDNARKTVADILGAKEREIIFTGSGTESINLAIKGLARARKSKGKHIITTNAEHHAVLETCEYLKDEEGFDVTFLDVDRYGMVSAEQVEKAIKDDTILITIMYANNEIGSVNPIKEIADIAKKHRVIFHTDACQAAGYLDINAKELGVDMMTINSSKLYGPKGVGALYMRSGLVIKPIIHGGGQESGLRSGTENVPGIVGFAKALEIAQEEREKEVARLTYLRNKMIKGIMDTVPKTMLNGHPEKRLPNNVNISFLDIEGEALLLYMDEKGIHASSGSACTSKTLDPSHVIIATGVPYEVAHGSIRFTLGKRTTEEDIDFVISVLPEIIKKLRMISPFNLNMEEVLAEVKQ